MEKSLSKVNNFRRDANEDTTYNSSLEEDKENAENFSKMVK